MKILVTGAKGQLGNELRELSFSAKDKEFFFTDIEELDITDYESVESFVISNRIDLIINCAAYTAVDRAESEVELAYRINRDAVYKLAKAINKNNGVLIHISTDFVFDGSKNTPYVEEDSTNPISVYGKSKLEGENAAFSEARTLYVIRTSWLYSSYGNNFVKTIIRLAEERKKLNVVFDQVGTPTYASDLARTILVLTDKIEKGKKEILHFSNEGIASWYDFAVEICGMKGIECEIIPIETKDYPTPAKRPPYSVLNKKKIKSLLGIKIPYWKDSLSVCINKLKG
ncbi:MAG: dTDP-4-dehydrorhamnose reductase [Brevinematia bacterium]